MNQSKFCGATQRSAIQADGFADHRAVPGVASLPQSKTQDDYVVMTGLAVFRREARTQNGMHAEDGEKIRGNVLKDNLLRRAISREICGLIKRGRQPGEDAVPAGPVQKVRR